MHLLASQSLLSPWVKLLEVTHSYCEHTSVLEILNHHHQIMILLANIITILTDFKIFFRIFLTRFQVKVTRCALCPFFLECISSCNKMQRTTFGWEAAGLYPMCWFVVINLTFIYDSFLPLPLLILPVLNDLFSFSSSTWYFPTFSPSLQHALFLM